ncbi:unnamed protein product [Spirodela intermedia]|uniref:Uncharacterized protein n=1 Tax=Spirodela intermedia TaxID=51605 RepID=A0A7I8KXS6_SPIIN|nr:unnamed protein product [Spirodela intermedia]
MLKVASIILVPSAGRWTTPKWRRKKTRDRRMIERRQDPPDEATSVPTSVHRRAAACAGAVVSAQDDTVKNADLAAAVGFRQGQPLEDRRSPAVNPPP